MDDEKLFQPEAEESMTPEQEVEAGITASTDMPAEEPEGRFEDSAQVSMETTQPPESREKRSSVWRRVLWTGGGMLLMLLLGGILVYAFFYTNLEADYIEKDNQLRQANQQIEELQGQNEALSGEVDDLKKQVQGLEDERQLLNQALDTRDAHIALLRLLADVYAARSALTNGDAETALLFLSQADEKVQLLGEYLDSQASGSVSNMQKRLELVRTEMEEQPELALQDLDTLANTLAQLESTFFAIP